ncbi:phosphatidylinositol 3 and 4-kinase-domain-containing protein [Mycotypha africana]|uniref:phosphatidylinositol 3 and 4-kinase-domain-containing protein n=1 Tax=Mycotypha africana TaxID=64632 RepID=UPI002301BFB3|nr:phosphatidylinositol 3 and 4-kinase-domain-containing protein [Mycotypha africana]KAI8981837.1 phosphatidylinositol 3 and 4-kinase-domain-containing protein [Mycotypha africana]
MFSSCSKRYNASYSRVDADDAEEDGYFLEPFHHPYSVLVANRDDTCNVVPLLCHSSPSSPIRSPRSTSSTRHHHRRHHSRFHRHGFFFHRISKEYARGQKASFASLPAMMIADLQNGYIPELSSREDELESGWTILHRRRYKGKEGIGESRHPPGAIMFTDDDKSSISEASMIDEEMDPSDQVSCSVFVHWEPNNDKHPATSNDAYTMTMPSLFNDQSKNEIEYHRNFKDPIPNTVDKFDEIVQSVQEAIQQNQQPSRIKQGSSGSYFCRNTSGKIVGVFKPKNEEPYGRLNPKWTKWLHRNLFPFFFGRSCLIPNLGYASEAAASLLDRKLGSNIVPFTGVIELSSTSFHYPLLERRKKGPRPAKIGSFQCFLTDYKDADVFFRDHPYPVHPEDSEDNGGALSSVWAGCLGGSKGNEYEEEQAEDREREEDRDSEHTKYAPAQESSNKQKKKKKSDDFRWTARLKKQFQREFEQLVILDYLIRNTDRGLDNWMIKYCPPKSHQAKGSSSYSSSENENPHAGFEEEQEEGHIHVAAIDNGLAFPYKHPDEWRSYPYGWLSLPDVLLHCSFSEETRHQFLDCLSDPLWWRDTIRELRSIFEMDSDFDEAMFQKQMAVLKGQGYNVVRTLKDPRASPADLVSMQPVMIYQEEVLVEFNETVLRRRESITPLHKKKQKRGSSPRRPSSVDDNAVSKAMDAEEEEDEEEEDEDDHSNNKKNDHNDDVTDLGYFKRTDNDGSSSNWKDKVRRSLTSENSDSSVRKRKRRQNKYRAFDSENDVAEESSDNDDESISLHPKKRVTIIMENIELVKNRTWFTWC